MEAITNILFKFRPDHRNPQNWPGKAAPDPPAIVEQPSEIVGFRSVGVGGPVGHPQGVQGKTLIFNIKYFPKTSHEYYDWRCKLNNDKDPRTPKTSPEHPSKPPESTPKECQIAGFQPKEGAQTGPGTVGGPLGRTGVMGASSKIIPKRRPR